ncbi:MAG: hypothetical protein A2047_03905 [Omnitrophica bacterium GWA2_41_15]|nr:MAG: hypothetical protein A2047_03905 [Omnitrophica bacterium GWA2_41_15]
MLANGNVYIGKVKLQNMYKELIKMTRECFGCGFKETLYPSTHSQDDIWSHYCRSCRRRKAAKWIKDHYQQWFKRVLSYKRGSRPKRPLWAQNEYRYWLKWVAAHPVRRREIALNSYHRNKQME